MTRAFLSAMVLCPIAIGLIAMIAAGVCRAFGPGVRNLIWNAALLSSAIAPIVFAIGPRLPLHVRPDLMPAALIAVTPVMKVDRQLEEDASSFHSGGIQDPSGVERGAQLPNRDGLLFMVWLAGVGFFGLRFVLHLRSARQLVRDAGPITDARLSLLLSEAKMAVGYDRRVAVVRSRDIDIPVAAGIGSPTILLPEASEEWKDADLRNVLLHEIAHLKRSDILARAMSMLACALHWFNPVVWLLSELAARDAELAADNLVLNAGIRPSRYAETLLDVASFLSRCSPVEPAMSLASRSRLPRRIHAILSNSSRHSEVKASTRSLVLASACATVALAACVRLAPITVAKAAQVPLDIPPSDSSWIADATGGLIAILDDPSPQVRGEAARALGRLRATIAVGRLQVLLADSDKFVRYEARQALDKIGGSG
jgi:beta-lactamase regulating signal transducer with metallopeptidase domain